MGEITQYFEDNLKRNIFTHNFFTDLKGYLGLTGIKPLYPLIRNDSFTVTPSNVTALAIAGGSNTRGVFYIKDDFVPEGENVEYEGLATSPDINALRLTGGNNVKRTIRYSRTAYNDIDGGDSHNIPALGITDFNVAQWDIGLELMSETADTYKITFKTVDTNTGNKTYLGSTTIDMVANRWTDVLIDIGETTAEANAANPDLLRKSFEIEIVAQTATNVSPRFYLRGAYLIPLFQREGLEIPIYTLLNDNNTEIFLPFHNIYQEVNLLRFEYVISKNKDIGFPISKASLLNGSNICTIHDFFSI